MTEDINFKPREIIGDYEIISKIGKIHFTSLKVGLNRCLEWYKNYYKKI